MIESSNDWFQMLRLHGSAIDLQHCLIGVMKGSVCKVAMPYMKCFLIRPSSSQCRSAQNEAFWSVHFTHKQSPFNSFIFLFGIFPFIKFRKPSSFLDYKVLRLDDTLTYLSPYLDKTNPPLEMGMTLN